MIQHLVLSRGAQIRSVELEMQAGIDISEKAIFNAPSYLIQYLVLFRRAQIRSEELEKQALLSAPS